MILMLTGWRRYFNSAFHVLDATVIIASFVIDVALKGGLEEAGSLIIVLRLWRVFKIIEEFSTGAEDQMDQLYEQIEKLEKEKEEVNRENVALKERLEGLGIGIGNSKQVP
jgi:voltage-gated hydrogen channel 1